MARVHVKPELLKWAIYRMGDPTPIEVKFPKLASWLNGELQPTLKQLESFAKATSTPLGYFFLSKPPEETFPIPHYRTISDKQSSNPSPNLIETVHTMERRQDWMREYLIDVGQDPLDFVGSAKEIHDPKIIADLMRKKMNLETNWASRRGTWQNALSDLLQRIQDIGILVMINGIVGNSTRRKLDVEEFRGFVLVDEYAPLIFVNGADGKAAQMFTLAHELAHVWIGLSAAFDLSLLQPSDDKIERLCNESAAEFLVPENDFNQLWNEIKNDKNKYQQAARYFKVSELVAVRRALDLEFITFEDYKEFYEIREKEEEERAKNKSGGGGDFHNNANWRIGPKFADAIIGQVKEGKTLYRDAYKLTGIKGMTFDNFVKHRSRKGGYQ